MNALQRNWKQNFFTIWAGQAFSQFSSAVLQFAIVWYLTDQTGSALVLTAAMMMGFLPQGVLGPFIGVFIDRYNRKRIMILSDLFISAASLVMVIAGWTGTLSTELILVVLFFRSIGSAFHTPCLQAVTPCRIFPGFRIRITDTEPGTGCHILQLLELKRHHLSGCSGRIGRGLHTGHYGDTEAAGRGKQGKSPCTAGGHGGLLNSEDE